MGNEILPSYLAALTVPQVEAILRDKHLVVSRMRIDPDGWVRVQVTHAHTARSHHGCSRDLQSALAAAFIAEERGVDVVTR